VALGIAVGDLVNALNLPMYVIGGGVASAWEAFSPYMFEELQKRSMVYAATAPTPEARQPSMGVPAFPSREKGTGAAAEVQPRAAGRKTIVTRALLGSDAGLYGAARLPMLGSDPAWD
jgi:glucokinase